MFRFIFNLLQRPEIYCLLWAVILIDVYAWTRYSRHHVPIIGLGCFCCSNFGSEFKPRIPEAKILADGSSIKLVDHFEYQEGVSNGTITSEPIGGIIFWNRRSSWGLAAPVFVHTEISNTPAWEPSATAQQQACFNSAAADFIASTYGDHPYVTLLRSGRPSSDEIQFGYALHDALIALLIPPALIGSIAAARRSILNRSAKRRLFLLSTGRCPRCLYDISASRTTCPECGEDIVEPRLAASAPPVDERGIED